MVAVGGTEVELGKKVGTKPGLQPGEEGMGLGLVGEGCG